MDILYFSIALSLSLGANAFFAYKFFQKSQHHKTQKDLKLLHDLMSRDRAIIEIRRIAPQSMFIRSPRDLE